MITVDKNFQFNECCLNSFVSPTVEVNKNESNEGHTKEDLLNAIHFYTEKIKEKCENKELKAKLYNDRATVYFKLGKNLAFVFSHSFHLTWKTASQSSWGSHEHTSVSRRSPRHLCLVLLPQNFSQFPLFPPSSMIISQPNISTVSSLSIAKLRYSNRLHNTQNNIIYTQRNWLVDFWKHNFKNV